MCVSPPNEIHCVISVQNEGQYPTTNKFSTYVFFATINQPPDITNMISSEFQKLLLCVLHALTEFIFFVLLF